FAGCAAWTPAMPIRPASHLYRRCGAMANDELCYLTIAEASRLVRARAISPVDLVEAVRTRIETHDGRVRAFLHVAGDQALAQARAAGGAPPRRGPPWGA